MEQGIKTVTLLCFIMAMLTPQILFTQPCLPDGITFTTQTQIDSFPIVHSSCTVIQGTVKIEGDDITNLSGLNAIISIEGDLKLYRNTVLNDLSGLNNLNSILGFLNIYDNPVLTSLEGLNGLTLIGIGVFIEHNPSLINLNGLNSLTIIEERLCIWDNDALVSLLGLNNLGEIGTSLDVRKNDALESLSGLEGLSLIGGGFTIRENPSLTSIEGLSNLPEWVGGIDIGMNPALNSLYGLENITSVGVDSALFGVNIYANDKLINLSGLDNIATIKGGLFISTNNSLLSFEGLNNLTSIDGFLQIWENHVLSNIEGMSGVTSLGSYLGIVENHQLRSLKGLDNIEASSIADLWIGGNDSLSICEVKSICDYLADPNGYILIDSNNVGCNNQEEVELACESAYINEVNFVKQLSTFPNPFTTTTTIEYELTESSHIQLTIYNAIGEMIQVAEDGMMPQGKHSFIWTANRLSEGLYYAVLRGEKRVEVRKMVKQ